MGHVGENHQNTLEWWDLRWEYQMIFWDEAEF